MLTLLYIIVVAFKGLCEGAGVLPDGPLNAALGGTVMFTTTLTPTDEPLTAVIWKFGLNNIIAYIPASNTTPPEYEDRITFFPSTGSLELRNLTFNDSGEYSVDILPGPLAGRTTLDIYERISGAQLRPTDLTIEGNSVNLTCDASGSPTARKWMKDGSDLILNDNMTLFDNNRVLSFNTLNRENSGVYLCNISNPVSSREAKYMMVVIFGPENVQITGERDIYVNDSIKLICSAESTPSATFTWMLNGSEILTNSPEFSKEKAELSDGGNYTCQAWNNITDRRSSVMFELFVHADFPGSSSPGLSKGVIAAITVACLVIVAAAVGGVYYICRNKKRGKKSSNRNTASTSGGGRQDDTAHGSEDLNYADINFSKNRNKGTVEMALENASSNYAEVRVNNNRPATSSPPTYDVHMQRANRPAPQVQQNQRH